MSVVAIGGPASAGVSYSSGTADSVPSSKIIGIPNGDGSTLFTTDGLELTVLPAAGPELSEAELSVLAPSMGCTMNVQYVHGSHHVSGTINGVAVFTCTVAPGSLTASYSLIRVSPNYQQWGAAPKNIIPGNKTLQINRAVPCDEGPGVFQGWAQGILAPPPGYVLSGPATNKGFGLTQPVACGLARVAVDRETLSSEDIAVIFVRSDLAV
ncbi:hypothetical protein [Homoserinimonas aerilata]|uniref:hypothetical protein n=1 Tax=Homoserinimonas aerilata TaxID=1162970 RepID=UPI00114F4675|nr:hypothetical protein [Homoserinimonas aerilata]